ncbi:MAG: rRNA maturation RNase YbeY [Candidatus Hydrogenedentes bacterium]|nr:rRNA maturation RNase YbeY [Candidatus Hydrogenedentota bacterium]
MRVTLDIRHDLCPRGTSDQSDQSDLSEVCGGAGLRTLARHVCGGEGLETDVEISLVLCDDAFIRSLNRRYRRRDRATDVLSFGQSAPDACGPAVLGDIVISLETVAQRCGGDSGKAREEVRTLFCHGLLHLLGYDHVRTRERGEMTAKQAEYLARPRQRVIKS